MRPLFPLLIPRFACFLEVAALFAAPLACAQNPPAPSSDMHGMVATSAGLLAIDPPPGWPQTNGPCLANFAPAAPKQPSAELCITSSPVESPGHNSSLGAFIAEDLAAFRQRFSGARVSREDPIPVPGYVQPATVYSFASGDPAHNAFERVAYIADYRRVWIFTLSAPTQAILERALPVFRAFVASYRGSIQFDGAS